MKTAVHQYEDKLLEFAYGELPANEAAAVDAHVRGCTRCSEALSQIQSVRSTMSALPLVPAPDAGLESLLAYAEQTAKRNREARKKDVWWRRYLMPLASAAALMVVGVVAWRASQEFNPDPAMIALEMQKEREAAQAPAPPAPAAAAPVQDVTKGGARPENEPAALNEGLSGARPDGVAADDSDAPVERRKAAAPAPRLDANLEMAKADKAADPADAEKKKLGLLAGESGEGGFGLGSAEGGGGSAAGRGGLDTKSVDALAGGKVASKPTAKSVPQSQAKRELAPVTASKQSRDNAPADFGLMDDYSNAAQRGASKKAAPMPAPQVAEVPKEAPVADTELSKNQRAPGTQGVWGLGTGNSSGFSTGPGASGGSMGGLAQGDSVADRQEAAPEATSRKKAVTPQQPVRAEEPVAQALPPPPSAQPQAEPVPAPAATGAPSAPSAPKTRGSLSIGSLSSSTRTASPSFGAEEEAVQVAEDSLGADRDAQLRQRQVAAERQKNLEAARSASNRNDRVTEVKYALAVLNAGAQGYEKLEALKRICDAYEAMGEYDRGQPYCDTLLSEFPNSAAAQAVAQRRNRMQKAPAPAKRAAERKYEFDDEKAPAKPGAPAEAAPARD
ncbi:MAG: zf-HC2 domain-containing protein [Myxococcota bacterium]